jgi:hypothetical protein
LILNQLAALGASSSACGFEDPGWANVLPHAGGVEGKPDDINEDDIKRHF